MAWGKPSSAPPRWLVQVEENDIALTSLHVLAFRKLTDEQLLALFRSLETNTALEHLYMSGHTLTNQQLELVTSSLKLNRTLRSINVGCAQLGDAGVSVLCEGLYNHPSITTVDLELKSLSSVGANVVARHLISGIPEDPSTTPASAQTSSSSSLHTLVLSRNPIGNEGLSHIGSHLTGGIEQQQDSNGGDNTPMCCRRSACTSDSNSSSTSNTSSNNTATTTTTTTNNSNTNSSLRILKLSSCDLGAEGALSFSRSLQTYATTRCRCQSLSELHLEDNPSIGEEGGAQLLECLLKVSMMRWHCIDEDRTNARRREDNDTDGDGDNDDDAHTGLHRVNLSRTALGDSSLTQLGNSFLSLLPLPTSPISTPLLTSCSLRYLQLDECDITDVGITGLATAIAAWPELSRLSLCRNSITDEGARVLAEAYSRRSYPSSAVTTTTEGTGGSLVCGPRLELGENKITTVGASVLIRSQQFDSLNLFGNALHDGAVSTIIDALRGTVEASAVGVESDAGLCHCRLRVLDIGGNKLGIEKVEEICVALAAGGNDDDDDGDDDDDRDGDVDSEEEKEKEKEKEVEKEKEKEKEKEEKKESPVGLGLEVLVLGGNEVSTTTSADDGVEEKERWEAVVERLRKSRRKLDVVWKAKDEEQQR